MDNTLGSGRPTRTREMVRGGWTRTQPLDRGTIDQIRGSQPVFGTPPPFLCPDPSVTPSRATLKSLSSSDSDLKPDGIKRHTGTFGEGENSYPSREKISSVRYPLHHGTLTVDPPTSGRDPGSVRPPSGTPDPLPSEAETG